MSVPVRTVVFLLVGIASLLVIVLLWFALARPVQVLPRIRPAPTFTLTDQDGRWFSDSDAQGQIILMHFTYTRCAEQCALMTERLRDVRDQMRSSGQLGNRVQFVTVSFDPDYDTPAILRRYAAAMEADTSSWHVLTGDPSEIKNLVGGGFGVYYKQQAEANTTRDVARALFTHDQRVALIDGQRLLRAEYDAESFESWRVLRDIGLIQRESSSSGAMRSVYEAAHLFVCYPQ
jgi:protein SCO1/2